MIPVRRWLSLALLLALVLGVGSLATAPPAAAAGSVTVTSSLGNGVVAKDGATTITVTGSGFQSIQGGFGGIYVLFGWVDSDAWQPSKGGSAGATYLYVPDSETASNQGYQRFVAFPGSSTAESANGGLIAANGSWRLTMVVPGPTFTAKDRNGHTKPVNCVAVRCGVITVGAHGVVNANNETFTPITFGGAAAQATQPARSQQPAQTQQPAATQNPASQAPAGQPAAEGQPAGDQPAAQPAGVGVTSNTVVAGRVLTFSGRGFLPGEQVVASLGGGQAAAGPLVAGNSGEIAGVMALPGTIRPGTHTLTLVGAASGQTPTVDIKVMADPAVAANLAEAGSGPFDWALIAVVATAALLLLVIISSAITALVRRSRNRAAAPATGAKGKKRVRRRKVRKPAARQTFPEKTSGGTAVPTDQEPAPAVVRPAPAEPGPADSGKSETGQSESVQSGSGSSGPGKSEMGQAESGQSSGSGSSESDKATWGKPAEDPDVVTTQILDTTGVTR